MAIITSGVTINKLKPSVRIHDRKLSKLNHCPFVASAVAAIEPDAMGATRQTNRSQQSVVTASICGWRPHRRRIVQTTSTTSTALAAASTAAVPQLSATRRLMAKLAIRHAAI